MGGPTWATVGCFVPVPLCLPSFSRPRGGRVVVASVELIIARSYGFWPRCDGGLEHKGGVPGSPSTPLAWLTSQLSCPGYWGQRVCLEFRPGHRKAIFPSCLACWTLYK